MSRPRHQRRPHRGHHQHFEANPAQRHPVLFAAGMGMVIAGVVLVFVFGTWWMLTLSVAGFFGSALLAGVLDIVAASRRRRPR